MEKLHIDGMRFVNESENEVILNGINVLQRNRETGHFYPELESDYAWMQDMGFNLIRFGIFWDAVEPEPGRFDEAYLAEVRRLIQKAGDYGLYVMVDMHQDLFAAKFIDGAPDWACLDEGLYHPENCNMWYEAYLTSDAIIRAADNFWANKEAADGVGLLDHYEEMWKVIARSLGDLTNVIGFEPMNEPFMGSIARQAFGAATMEMLKKNPSFNLQDPASVKPEEAAEFMSLVVPSFLQFDQTTLMDFYRRMERAIRESTDIPVVTGGNIYCSTDLPTGISRLSSAQIYGPHGYDTVVDSDRYEAFSKENVERLYAGKRASQLSLSLPVIADEWGAFPSKPFTNDLIRHMIGIVETYLWGSAYCEYHPGMDRDPNFGALKRAYPMETAGTLLAYHYEEIEQSFMMEFMACKGQTTCIFLPFAMKQLDCTLRVETRMEGQILYVTALEEGACRLEVQG